MGGCKSYMDLLYLFIVGFQVIGMFVNDFLPMFPTALYRDPSGPLHFLWQSNRLYVEIVGDPYARNPPDYPWFEAFAYVELVSQFPLALYFISKVLSKRPIDGPAEIAGLAFGCLNFMGSAVCTYDLWYQAPALFGPGQQMRLIFTMFGPYTVISAIMAVDMYTRLLKRIQEPTKAKNQ